MKNEGICVIVVLFGDEDNLNEVEVIVFIGEDVIKLKIIDKFRYILDEIVGNIFNG